MEITNTEKAVLKILVEKELQHVQEDSATLALSNSPFLGKVADDDNDLEFIKKEQEYILFLQDLLQKL